MSLRFVSTVARSAGVICLLVSSARASTIRVPLDQLTIQAGVTSAVAGDTVLVSPGVYMERVNLANKQITLLGRDGSAATTIDAADGGTAVASLSGAATLAGFTISRGSPYGVQIPSGSPTLNACDILACATGLLVSIENGGNNVRGNTFSLNDYPVRLHPGAVDSVVANNIFLANASNQGNAYLVTSGTITESTIWPVPTPGFCYGLYQDYVQLNSAAAVWQIQGAVLKMWSSSDIRIGSGQFIADGVVFTSRADDTLGSIDGDGDGGAPGQWQKLDFNVGAGGASRITNCVFRYGGQDYNHGVLELDNIGVAIDSCLFTANDNGGLYVSTQNGGNNVRGNTFTDNEYPVQLHPGAVDSVLTNNFFIPTVSGQGNAFIVVAGTITESTSWPTPPAGFCYGLPDDYVSLNSGIAVWQVQDAVLKMWSGSDIRIDAGRLIANGVVFTSRADDTLGSIDGNGDGGAPGQWEALDFNSGSGGTSELIDCEFRYGGQDYYDGAVHLENTGVRVESSRFMSNKNAGLFVGAENGGNRVRLNTFADNECPVRLHPGAVDSVVAHNYFVSNPSGIGNAYMIGEGTITESTVWPEPSPGFCYGLYDDYVQLNSGTAVWHLQNAVLKLWPSADIRITAGRLIVTGVVFTSRADDTLGSIDGNGDGPAPGQWEALDFNSGASGLSEVHGCVFRYGGRDYYDGAMHLENTAVTVASNQFTFNSNSGLYVATQNGGNNVRGNTFENNDYPVRLHPGAVDSVVANNTFVWNPTGQGNAYLVTAGTITESTVWPSPAPGFCYGLYEDYVQLNSSAATWQLHDAVLKMWPSSDLRVATGRIIAHSVVFTSRADDTLGSIDGNGDGGAPGQWDALNLNAGASSTSEIDSCIFRYGGEGFNYAALRLDNTATSVTRSAFAFNRYSGMFVSQQNGGNNVRENIFYDNEYPVRLHPGAIDSVVANNNFVPNASGQANAYLVIAGSITESTVWPVPAVGFCYGLYQDYVQLNSGAAVWHIQDAVLKLWPSADIRIDAGQLIAGDVVFTSSADDTLGSIDGDGDGGAPGQWQSLDFNSGASANSQLTNCIIRFGGASFYNGAVQVDNSAPKITSCQIYTNLDAGIYASGAGAQPTVLSCLIAENESRGVWCSGNATPEISQCSITNNTSYGVYSSSSTVNIQAIDNWWGDATGPMDTSSGPPDYNPMGAGDAVTDYVVYRPWSNGVPTNPGAPFLTALIDAGTGHDLVVKWTQPDRSGITGYQVHYGVSPGVYVFSSEIIDEDGSAEYQHQLSELDERVPYYVAVRAFNADSGEWSEYSSIGPRAPRIPTVLVHGWRGGSPQTWDQAGTSDDFRGWLEEAGFSNIWIPGLNSCGPEGEKQFDKNAQALADYILTRRDALYQSLGITNANLRVSEVNIVAHSMGGLISRRLIATRTAFGMQSVHVRSLTMLGTPNRGTLYANAGCLRVCILNGVLPCNNELGRIVCWGPATCELSSISMASFNTDYPSSATDTPPFYAVAGNACCNFKQCSDWWCYGSSLDHDGTVAVSSVLGIDLDRMYVRHATHWELPRNKKEVFEPIVLPILNDSVPDSDQLFNKDLIDSSDVQTVHLAALETDSVLWVDDTVQLSGAGAVRFWATGLSAEPEIVLVPPVGQIVDSVLALGDSLNYDFIHSDGIAALTVKNPADGEWIVRLRSHQWQDVLSEVYLHVEVESDVQLTFYDYLTAGERSDSVLLYARVSERGSALFDASVLVKGVLESDSVPVAITLLDDGSGHDVSADDGLYSGAFVNTQAPGIYTFQCKASGLDLGGKTFSRTAVLRSYISGADRGDLNEDGILDIFDVVSLVGYVFRGGLAPYPEFIADVNCDGVADVFDVVTLIGHTFRGATRPTCP